MGSSFSNMAAILCESVGSLCKGLCDVIVIPCKVCGECCRSFLMIDRNICRSDYCCYLSTTLFTNVPILVISLMSVHLSFVTRFDIGKGGTFLFTWFYVNGFLSIGHIAAAFYIIRQMEDHNVNPQQQQEPEEPIIVDAVKVDDLEIGKPFKRTNSHTAPSITEPFQSQQPPNSYQSPQKQKAQFVKINNDKIDSRSFSEVLGKAKEVLCYDPWVAIYILCFFFFIIWQVVGNANISPLSTLDDFDGQDTLDSRRKANYYILSSTIFGWIFVFLGTFSLFFSICFKTSKAFFNRRN